LRQNPPKSESYASFNVVQTAGAILDDGTVIELVEDSSRPFALALLKFDGHEPEIGPQIEHDGNLYVPPYISPTVRSALRLPSGCAQAGPTAQLFARLLALFENITDLAEHARNSVVAFLLASWIPELIPVPVTLFLWSPDPAAGARVLAVLSSLCRLALLLSGSDARDLRVVPDDLPSTLLLFRPPTSRRSLESLGALGWPGFRICRRGRLVETVGAKAIVSDNPLPDNKALGPTFVAHVATSRRPLPPLDKKTLEALAKEFLPQLLRYRLQRCTTVVAEGSTNTYSASPPSSLVTALEVCLRHEPALLEAVSPLIDSAQNGDEPGRSDPRVPLLDVVLARCHESDRKTLYVGEIVLDLNARILANGGTELSCRMIGNLFRSLGLVTQRLDRRGRGLVLDGSTRQLIHRLAREHDAPSAGDAFPLCAECARGQPRATSELEDV
jgi:hypothetical protein